MAMVSWGVTRGFILLPLTRSYQTRKVNTLAEKLTTRFTVKNIPTKPLKLLAATVPIAGGYYLYKSNQNETSRSSSKIANEHTLLASKPDVPVSRTVPGAVSDMDLNLTLYQYPTCPFCCKVRAFLDYYGLPYDVIEVDPVLRQQTSWTTYKKVPILLAKVEGGYQQLNDSTMIISALKSYFLDKNMDLKNILNFYPIVEFEGKGSSNKTEILNKYFLMYQNVPKGKTTEIIQDEKKWREWADNVLVHTLSPNVYRTWDESMQAFKWFSEVGEWERLFPAWERAVIVYVGAFAMWIISKRLKKRHNLKEDVRESLFDACRMWMKDLNAKKTTFHGGKTPDLADLAVYGVLSSIEGCLAFNDLLEKTSIKNWYYPMKEAVKNHEGKREIML